MKKKVLAIVGILVLVAIIYGYQEFTRGNINLSHAKPDYKIEAKDFVNEFEENESNANKKFLDRIVAVNGAIKDIRKEEGFYTIMLGEKGITSSVRCSIDPDQHIDESQLQLESVIIVKGVCTGFNSDELLGSDVILNRCVIEINSK